MLSQIDTEMALARAALKSGDYASALTYAVSAQGMLAVTPDTQKGDLQVGFGRRSGEIEAFVANVRKRQAAAGGIQRSKVTYARPSD